MPISIAVYLAAGRRLHQLPLPPVLIISSTVRSFEACRRPLALILLPLSGYRYWRAPQDRQSGILLARDISDMHTARTGLLLLLARDVIMPAIAARTSDTIAREAIKCRRAAAPMLESFYFYYHAAHSLLATHLPPTPSRPLGTPLALSA